MQLYNDLNLFIPWVKKNIIRKGNNGLPNGFLFLKGGDLTEELAPFKKGSRGRRIKNFF